MSLLDSEIREIYAELGWSILTSAAEPYISIVSLQGVIQDNVTSGASTTSSTTVAAATVPTPSPLTLTSATGFHAGDRIVVDVDSRQERVTVQSVSGSAVTALLKLAHSGTYPVVVESGETLIRDTLTQLRDIRVRLGSARGRAGLKKVDEVEFYEGKGSSSAATAALHADREYYRDELARLIGCARPDTAHGGGSSIGI